MVLTDIEKKGLRRIVEQFTLRPESKRKLKDAINNNLIISEKQLMREIKSAEIKEGRMKDEEKRKKHLIEIVSNTDLDLSSKFKLKDKIKHNLIKNEIELNKEIEENIKKIKMKDKLIKHLSKVNLTSNSKKILENKIKNNLITSEEQLMKEIEKQRENSKIIEEEEAKARAKGRGEAGQRREEALKSHEGLEEDHDYRRDLYN